jgi:lipopolysaccharide heptosyltransferase II
VPETTDNIQPLGEPRWDWSAVKKVLIVRLRSIGDTVLTTPSLIALRRYLPEAQIDILLETQIAPVLDGFDAVDNIIKLPPDKTSARLQVSARLHAAGYDVVYNLHGGTTAAFLTFATGARHRAGYASHRYAFLHNHQAPPASELWKKKHTHSAEQQMGLLGWTGVPVSDAPKTRLAVTEDAIRSLNEKLAKRSFDLNKPFAVIHPAAAFESKQWALEKFARTIESLREKGIAAIAVCSPPELPVLKKLQALCRAPLYISEKLNLPEVSALLSRSVLFVGNDSGIAHMAAALQLSNVVIFGSANVHHWQPFTDTPSAVVRVDMPCAPCPGYVCKEFEKPECVRRVTVEMVNEAIENVLSK